MNNISRNHCKGRISLHQLNIIFSIFIIAVVFTFATSNHLFDNFQAIGNTKSLQTISYTISSGDTLWNLAAKSITKGEDVRNKIIAIQKINGLSASQHLQPGQIIQIPLCQPVDDHFRFTMNSR